MTRQATQQGPVAFGAYRRGALASYRGSPSVSVFESFLVGEDGSLPPVERYEIGAQTMDEGLDLAPLVEALLGGDTPAGTVRPMMPFSRTDGLSATIGDLDLAVGEIVFDGLSVRQPEEPLLAVVDDLATGALDAEDDGDLPELIGRLAGFFRSFGYSVLSVEAVSVDTPDVAFGLALAESRGVSKDGIGRVAVEGMTLSVPDEEAKLLLGLLEIAEVGFPALEDILAFGEAMAAAEATPEKDDGPGVMKALAINPTIGRYALEGFDLSSPEMGRMSLDAVRLEQGGFIGPIPTDVSVLVEGMRIPVELLAQPAEEGGPPPAAAAFLESLGLETFAFEGRLSVRWDEASESLSLGPLAIAVSQLGSLSVDLRMDGLPRFVIENPGFIEVVATDGAVTPRRQKALFALTDEAGFSRDQVAFLTAYQDRESAGFRKTVSGLAWGSFAWFVSEPDKIVILRDGATSPARLADLLTR